MSEPCVKCGKPAGAVHWLCDKDGGPFCETCFAAHPCTKEHGEGCATTVFEGFDEAKVDACARAAHEANRAYCIALGDLSQPSWEAAPDWQKSSARQGVGGALAGNTPEQSHESWLAEKRAAGWKYGPVKDPEKKLHPCFMPYADLPPAQRAKDAVFVTVVRAMGAALGLI